MSEEIKMYCLYHRIDLDGWMSAAIVMLWYEKTYGDLNGLVLIGWNYGDPIPVLATDIPVIMVDISFPMPEMLEMGYTRKSLLWIDHHISAINDWKKYTQGILNRDTENVECVWPEVLGESCTPDSDPKIDKLELVGACELAWRHLFQGEKMPEIVRLLGCYDSFRHKGSDEEGTVFAFQYAARASLTNPEECHKILQRVISIPDWCNMGAAILNYLKVEARSIYKNRMEYDFEGLKIAAINRERFNPSSYDIDYHSDGYDAFMCYSRMKDGRWTFSIYNENGKVDVSVLAKSMGGGGHVGAAGWVSVNLQFLSKYTK